MDKPLVAYPYVVATSPLYLRDIILCHQHITISYTQFHLSAGFALSSHLYPIVKANNL